MGKLIVTIARQYGSGGKTIGQMLAENLGVNCYNREILRMASDDSGIKEELFNQADEKLRNNPLFGNSTRIYKGGLIQPDHGGFVSADNLFNYQAKVIKERPDVMSVFIHAPQDYCLARGMERNSMTEKEMERFIAKTDKYRGDFYHYYTGRTWNDARNYDLCLDSSKLGFDKCVEAIKAYAKVRFGEDIFE